MHHAVAGDNGETGASTGQCQCEDRLLNPYVILGLIIWLLILTLLLLVLFIIAIRHQRAIQQQHKHPSTSSGSVGAISTTAAASPWLDALREEGWQEYHSG